MLECERKKEGGQREDRGVGKDGWNYLWLQRSAVNQSAK